MLGKWIDENFDVLSKEFNNIISIKISRYYTNSFNIVNPVLSRNINSSNIFRYFCEYKYNNKLPTQVLVKNKVIKLIKYYLKSFIYFIFILIHLFIYKLAYKKYKPKRDKEIILIDTFTMIDKIFPNGYKDNYFGELEITLKEKKVNYAILAILFGDKPYNLRRRFLTYRLLNNDNRTFLTEFEFLKLIDYFKLFYFMLAYPFHHISTKAKDNNDFSKIYNVALYETIDVPQIHNYVRYLFARRLGEYFKNNIKMITWDENQVIHKLLNKGIRETNNNVTIFGTKFFGFTLQWLSLINIKSEIDKNVAPDNILIKGEYYNQFYNNIHTSIGYSSRESYLYKVNLHNTQKYIIGVLLGYNIEENRRIILYLEQANIEYDKIIIRIHPNHKLNTPFKIPKHWDISNEDMIEFANKTKLIISAGTGAALELMCMNKRILIIGEQNKVTTITLPHEYKGYNWDIFYTPAELESVIKRDIELKEINLDSFFQESTKEQIIKSLEL